MSQKKTKKPILRAQNTVQIPASVIDSIDLAMANLVDARLPAIEEAFLTALILLARDTLNDLDHQDTVQYVDFSFNDLSDILSEKGVRGVSKRALRQKLERLTESGFFHIRKVSAPPGVKEPVGGRQARTFILHPIHEQHFESKDMQIIRELAEGRRHKRGRTNRSLANLLERSSHQVTVYNHGQKALTENILTGICDRSQRFTTQEVIDGNRITSGLKVRGVNIHVQSTTSTHPSAELAALADQRVTRAVISEITHKIDEEIEEHMRNDGPPGAGQFDMLEDFDAISDADYEEELAQKQELASVADQDGNTESSFISSYESDLLKREKEATAKIKNDFFIDTTNLCRRCDYTSPTSSSARRFVNQSLRRQYDTNYRIRLKAADAKQVLEVMNIFGLPDHTTDIRFITSLKSQFDPDFMSESLDTSSEPGLPIEQKEWSLKKIEEDIDPYNPDEIMRVRYWRISLDPLIFEQLLNRETRRLYTAHPQIMSEGSGLAQTLYNVFSAIIGRTNQEKRGNKPRVFNRRVNDLHNHVWPTRSYSNFQDELVSIMKRYASSWDDKLGINRASMWGYIFTLYDRNAEARKEKPSVARDLWLKVVRDPDDELAGDNSYYNRFQVEGNDDRSEAGTEDDVSWL